MGRMYSAVFEGVAVTAAQDLFSLQVPADTVAIIHSVSLGQTSDVGDAAEENLDIALRRIVTPTTGSGGTAPTPIALSQGDAAAGSTVRVNDTTEATGTITSLARTAWNIRGEYLYVPTPETQIEISPSTYFIVGLMAAPADSLTMSGTLVFEELGG